MSENEEITTNVNVPLPEAETPEKVEFDRSGVYLMWGLFAGSFILPLICTIAAVVVAYIKRGDSTTKEELSHFDAGIKTFWTSVICMVIAIPLTFVGIGAFIALGVTIYFIYRIVRGFIRVSDGREY
jgi:uncharacterized membrane protein